MTVTTANEAPDQPTVRSLRHRRHGRIARGAISVHTANNPAGEARRPSYAPSVV